MAGKLEQKFRDGALNAVVWHNQGQGGKSFKSVSIQKRYQDEDGEWKSTYSFNSGELNRVIGLLAQAANYLNPLKSQDEAAAEKPQDTATPKSQDETVA